MSTLPKIKQLEAAINLATWGAQKSIIKCYYPNVKDIAAHFREDPRGQNYRHRDGDVWLRAVSRSAYMADRLYRLYSNMFPNNLDFCARKFSILDLSSLFFTYKSLYPSDVMSVNRVHYWVQLMRTQSIFAAEKCACCKQPFIFHPHDIRNTCALCDEIEEVKKEESISENIAKVG